MPFDYEKYFDEDYLRNIKFVCLIMSKGYISEHFSDIKSYANIVEKRLYDDCEMENLIHENECNLRACKKYRLNYIYIDDAYSVDYEFQLKIVCKIIIRRAIWHGGFGLNVTRLMQKFIKIA